MGANNSQVDERKFKALAAVQEWSKQIMTLSAGTLVLSGAFIRDIFDKKNLQNEDALGISWILFILTLTFGIFVLGAVTHELDRGSNPSAYSKMVVSVALIQQVLFLGGIGCFAGFAWTNLGP